MALDARAIITYGFWEVDSDGDEWAARLVSDGYLDTLPDHSTVIASALRRALGWVKMRAMKRRRRHK